MSCGSCACFELKLLGTGITEHHIGWKIEMNSVIMYIVAIMSYLNVILCLC